MCDEPQSTSAVVRFRRSSDGSICETQWVHADDGAVASALPWRVFRWRHGQRHYSGTYWAATTGDHVIYESRLELARVLFADFDVEVSGIVAQPFLLLAQVEGRLRRHIPDYFLVGRGVPTVVDVKPRSRLTKPDVRFTFDWTRHLVEQRGWRYEVWSEPSKIELANLRFLAGFRRAVLFDSRLVDRAVAAQLEGTTIDEACRLIPDWPAPLVRSAILHLIWTRHFTIDLARPLQSAQILSQGVRE